MLLLDVQFFFTHGIHQPHEPPDEELVELVERAINGMN